MDVATCRSRSNALRSLGQFEHEGVHDRPVFRLAILERSESRKLPTRERTDEAGLGGPPQGGCASLQRHLASLAVEDRQLHGVTTRRQREAIRAASNGRRSPTQDAQQRLFGDARCADRCHPERHCEHQEERRDTHSLRDNREAAEFLDPSVAGSVAAPGAAIRRGTPTPPPAGSQPRFGLRGRSRSDA